MVNQRQNEDILRALQKLAFYDGVLFENCDFGDSATSTKVYPLKHTLGRKARGITILGCKCKRSAVATTDSYPTHASTLDDNNIANVALSANQANNFIWSFWVW